MFKPILYAAALAALFFVAPAHAGTTISAIGVNGCGTTKTGTADGATLTVDQNTGDLCIGSSSAAPSNVTIAGPLGAQQGPAAAVGVVQQDDFNACSGTNTCSATGATTLFCSDMLGYQSVTSQILTNTNASTVTYETTDDPAGCASTNWIGSPGLSVTSTGTQAANTITAAASIMQVFSKHGRWFRGRVSTFVAGSVTNTANLHAAPATVVISALALQATAAVIGEVAPGYSSAQTPFSQTASGTTAAVVLTIPANATKTNYLCGYTIDADATAAGVGSMTITGLLGGTQTRRQGFGAVAASTVTTGQEFANCLKGSGTNTAIVITSAAAGTAGNTNVNAHGYVE